MNRKEFDKLRDGVYEGSIKKPNDTKGKDYSGDDDAFANFKRNANQLNLRPTQVWAVYFMKHIDAIMSYISTNEVKSEPIEGRIDDAITYLFLLRGMLAEADMAEIDNPEMPVEGSVEYVPERESYILRGRHGSSEVTNERLDQAREEARKKITISSMPESPGSLPNGCYCHPIQEAHSASCSYRIDWEKTHGAPS